jgi:hypothetical protein
VTSEEHNGSSLDLTAHRAGAKASYLRVTSAHAIASVITRPLSLPLSWIIPREASSHRIKT